MARNTGKQSQKRNDKMGNVFTIHIQTLNLSSNL